MIERNIIATPQKEGFHKGNPSSASGEQSRVMSHPSTMDTPEAQPRAVSPHPLAPTQLRALLWRGCLLVVGLVGHGAGDAALAPALAVGGFATFGGDSFFLIVVFSGCVVVLVPAKAGREEKKRCLVGLIFRSSNYFSARVWGCFFIFCCFFRGAGLQFFFCRRRLFSWLGLAVG